MLRKAIFCALASAAMVPAATAHPGGGGGPPAGVGGAGNAGGFGMGGPGGMGDMHGVGMGGGFGNGLDQIGSSMRDRGRINSQGPAEASQMGLARANENSVLAGTTATKRVTSGVLAGLRTGTTLYSNGMPVGTVQQIRTTGTGAVALVIVKGTNGGLYAVPAHKLSYSGGTLVTSSRLAGINASTSATTTAAANGQRRLYSQGPAHASAMAIAHANQHSVLYGTSTTASAPTRRRLNSQGALHASATGIAHANQHSVLYGGSTTALAGTTPTSLPLASRRRLSSQGALHASATGIAHANQHSVLYSSAGASTMAASPANPSGSRRRLNSQGAFHASATGIAHANSHSAIYGAPTHTVPGVSVGMPLFSNGSQVGTVYRVVTANGVIRRVLVQSRTGRIYSLAPSTLTESGGSVTTSVALHGM